MKRKNLIAVISLFFDTAATFFLDPWTGRVVRRDEGLKLACSKWGSVNYTRDELRQIRDWLKRHLLVRVPAVMAEGAAEETAART